MIRIACAAVFVLGFGLRADVPADLDDAIARGDVDGVKGALAKGADPNGREGAPTTPLTFAILKGDAAITRVLLSNNADPNLAGDVRPLYAAILRADQRAAEALVGAGADADVAGCVRATLPGTMQGETARAIAVRRGEPFVSIVAKAHPAPVRHVDKKSGLHHSTMCSD